MTDIQTKRGTTPSLAVTLSGLDANKTVAAVEFLFKQKVSEDADALVVKQYTGAAGDAVTYLDGVYYLVFTEAESRMFKPDNTYYMDTKVIYSDGSIPATGIVKLLSLPTLFEGVTA